MCIRDRNDGMDEFNEKAVKKIVDAVDGDIAGLIDKLKATVALGKDYDTFGGKSDKMCIRDRCRNKQQGGQK